MYAADDHTTHPNARAHERSAVERIRNRAKHGAFLSDNQQLHGLPRRDFFVAAPASFSWQYAQASREGAEIIVEGQRDFAQSAGHREW